MRIIFIYYLTFSLHRLALRIDESTHRYLQEIEGGLIHLQIDDEKGYREDRYSMVGPEEKLHEENDHFSLLDLQRMVLREDEEGFLRGRERKDNEVPQTLMTVLA